MACVSAILPASGRADWQETIDRVSPAIVELHLVIPRAFDGAGAGNSTATGFVVDAERGLILTNRHVVQPGPVRAQAVFLDQDDSVLRSVPGFELVFRSPPSIRQINGEPYDFFRLYRLP